MNTFKTIKTKKERKNALKRIAEFFPELFDEIELAIGELNEDYTISSKDLRLANDCICRFCLKNAIPYRELALIPDFI